LTVIEHGIFNLVVDGDIACMDFNPTSPRYPQELVTASFEREYSYLDRLSDYHWCPEVVRVDYANRQIYIKWYHNTCQDRLTDDWQHQLEGIARDLAEQRIYKPGFYPKFFYFDDQNVMHAYVFYGASDRSEQPIDMNFYRPILNDARSQLVSELEVDGKLDMFVLLTHAFNDYIKWPGDPLPGIYQRVYQQTPNNPL
jgi:hypothetical protein